MSRVLVYFVHADPVVRALYDAALANVGASVDIVFVNAGGLSSAYDKLAAKLTGGPTRLDALKAKFRPPHADYTATIINTFSAGYALARWLLGDPATVAEVHGYSAIDSVHAGLDPDGTARDASLPWLVDFAKLAREGNKSLWLGHTDVQTPQMGPGAFASTTQVAKELVRLAGEPTKRFHVQAFNVEQNPATEHRRALTGWGPEWLAACVREVLEAQGPPPPPPPAPPTGDSLGLRALKMAVEELKGGVVEVPPGSNAGPRIKQYFSGCERAGKKLGISAGPWCAAAASWCAFQARKPHEEQPHKWRAAVTELVADARTSGTWCEKSSSYKPVAGDLAIFKRGGGDPTKGGIGHVGRIESVSTETYVTVDGNSGTPSVGWARNTRRFDDPMLCGWISYGPAATPSSADLLAAATLRAEATAEVS